MMRKICERMVSIALRRGLLSHHTLGLGERLYWIVRNDWYST
jgi:hypothetical protein